MVPEKISGHLKGSHIRFAVRPHPRAVTAQELAAAVHVSGHRVAKSVLIEADGEPMMAVLPAADVIDVERLATALGVFAVRLMSEAEFTSLFSDSDTGAEPPFGSLYGVPVVVDKRLAKPGTMIVRAGSHQEAIEMRYQDFARLERPRVEDFAVPATSTSRFVDLDEEDTNPGGTISVDTQGFRAPG
jgi:Ala-tRNA(Pro) deacylase